MKRDRYIPDEVTKANRRHLRLNPNKAEQVFWYEIRNGSKLGCRFRRQVSIDSFIVDFYCHELRLVIELDGPVHETLPQPSPTRGGSFYFLYFFHKFFSFNCAHEAMRTIFRRGERRARSIESSSRRLPLLFASASARLGGLDRFPRRGCGRGRSSPAIARNVLLSADFPAEDLEGLCL
ncbi:MAG: DUF559 domain-containing protein [Patescibacteria group bacterium]